jgi:hypothetical protein
MPCARPHDPGRLGRPRARVHPAGNPGAVGMTASGWDAAEFPAGSVAVGYRGHEGPHQACGRAKGDS